MRLVSFTLMSAILAVGCGQVTTHRRTASGAAS